MSADRYGSSPTTIAPATSLQGNTIQGLFRSVARTRGGAPALLATSGFMSYRELDARSDRLATLLRSDAPEGSLVGLCVERGPLLVVGMLGILKAGMAYVPLDPSYPEPRLRFMTEDSRAPIIVAHGPTLDRLPRSQAAVVDLDRVALHQAGAAPPLTQTGADAVAYVCYTSGSTGRPKGALIPHRGVVRLVRGVSYADLGPQETILQLASPSFDATTFEVWGALLNGGRLAFPRSARPRLDEIGEDIRARGVTTLWLTAGLFHVMVDERLEDLRPLRQLLAGGDVLSPERVRRCLSALPHLRLVNGYGPTENTTFTCCHTLKLEEVANTVPIGRPIDGTYVRVLDAEGREVEPGQVGELHAGGDGLGLGYLNRPDLTGERFITDPYLPGALLYRTGDRVRARADGVLEFLGRVDDQVKIRGFRVEPGEVAAALRSVPGVRDAAVVARRHGDELRLVGYAVLEAGASLDEAALLTELAARVPAPLVPARIVVLAALPLTTNGKVDREALPEPAVCADRGRLPQGRLEVEVARAWREALRTDEVFANDDFLRAGGDSLKAAQVAARLSQALDVAVGVADLLEAGTIEGLARRLADAPRLRPVAPVAADLERAPLAPMQAQLWVVDRLVRERQLYLVPYAVRLRGPLDVPALSRALERLEARHAALRLRFEERDGSLQQTVGAPARVDLVAVDVREDEVGTDQLTARVASSPLDLTGRPWCATLLRLCAQEHVFLWTLHHLVTDGRSMSVLFRELAALYAHETGGPAPAPAPTRREYLGWCAAQASPDATARLEVGLAYWRQALGGRLPAIELPTDRPRPRRAGAVGGAEPIVLSAPFVARLRAVAAAEGVTPFVLLLAAFQALLHRTARADDVVVPVPHANRGAPELDDVVGLFVNMLPLRASFEGAPTFRELLARVRLAALGAFTHSDVPFARILGQLDLDRSEGAAAALPTMFALLDVSDLPRALGDLSAAAELVPNGGAKCDLGLLLEERADGTIGGVLEYRRDLFDPATVQRLGGHYVTLLAAALEDPTQLVAALPLLTAAQRDEVVVEWNRTDGPFPTDRLLHQLFEGRVDAAPDALAVTDGARTWTYGELEAHANRLAHRLQALGAGPGARVAICLERSLELVASILGVLKAGAAYVPLDPDHPRDRLLFMLEDAGAPVLVTQRSLLVRLPEARQVVCVDDPDEGPATRPACAAQLDDVAYIIYTSGSTGRPKGVVVRHRPALNVIDWVNSTFAVGPTDRLLFVTSPCFDLSVYDVLGTLAAGAQLHVALAPLLRDPARLAALLDGGTITIWDSAPPSLSQLEPWLPTGSTVGRLRLALLSGDWIPVTLPDRLRSAWPGVLVVSLGGATEATIWSNWYSIDAVDPSWTSIPYGRPIRNARYYVLDDRLQPAPVNVPGELWIGGACLADGYWNRPELSAQRFIVDPFSPGGKLYRTGDLARFRAGGELELLGRIDSQVKIRGHRIELGEVEAALAQLDLVAACVVVARGERGAERTLVGYVVPRSPDLSPQALRAALAERLPAPMVPGHIVFLDALPLTPNGKLDRAALPAPALSARALPEPPRDAVEAELAAALALALGVERVGVGDDFFALGGHSLTAVRAIAEVRRRLNVELPLPAFFAAPTVKGLRAAVARLAPADGTSIPAVPRGGRRSWPVTSAQRRLWFLERLHGASSRYTVSVAVALDGPLDVAALRTALDALVQRHEPLRTIFGEEHGRPVQVVAAPRSLGLELDDLSDLADPARAADELSAREATWMFDPAVSCTRVRLLRLGAEEHRLLLTQHHLVTDGATVAVLLRDLAALYEAALRARPADLPPVPVQLVDFATWEEQWLVGAEARAQLEVWRERLAGAPVTQTLPADLTRSRAPSLRGDRRSIELPRDVLERVLAVGRAEGATAFATLLAGFAAVLHRRGGDSTVVVSAAVTARRRAELMGAAGFFVNTLPLRIDLDGAPSYRTLVARTRASVLDAFGRADVPLDRIIEGLRPARDGSGTPFQQVLFMESTASEPVTAGELRLTPRTLPNGGAKFELLVDVARTARGATVTLEFAADLLSPAAAERLLGHFATLLESAADAPDLPVSSLTILGEAERRLVVEEWNDTTRDYPRDRCVHELLARHASFEPERTAVALTWERAGKLETLSYAGLIGRARRLAQVLSAAGVGVDVPVGVFLDRSPELVVALVAVLEAGGAYLPLDPDYPAERLRFMLDDSRAPVVITTTALASRLPEGARALVLVDALPPAKAPASPAARPTADSLAYVIYTSGSTGRPKGVAVTHRGVVRLVRGADYVTLGPDETHLLLAPISFDASTFELWGALLNGGRVALAPAGAVGLEAIGRAIERFGVTTLWLTAGLFHAMVDERLGDLRPLRQLVTGGDVVSPAHARRVLEALPGLRLVNGYGPTECTTFACCHTIRADDAASGALPIGRPIANTRAYVVDPRGAPLPIGDAGELWLGGDGVARGYLERPELTSERFVDDPFVRGGRVYRTGDSSRWRPDGTLEFLGRLDRQVKLRGHRIEPGELEGVLTEHETVREAAVAVQEGPDGKSLVAFVVLREGEAPNAEALLAWLSGRVPAYLSPARVVPVARMPLDPNGKVDRRALIESARTERRPHRPPRDAVERALAAIWVALLGVPQVGLDDDFFALGGHSLLALRLSSRIEVELSHALPIAAIFAAPTLEAMAQVVRRREGQTGLVVSIDSRGQGSPLFAFSGIGGHPFTFRALARHLGGERPILGLQAIGLDGLEPCPTRIVDVAARYVQELLRVQPRGPYQLVGYSYGGLVAYEVAVQLRARGHEVSLVGLIDCPAPGYPARRSLHERLSVHAQRLVEASWLKRARYLAGRARNVLRRFGVSLPSRSPTPPEGTVAALIFAVKRALWHALHHYRPSAGLDAPLLVLRAEGNVDPFAAFNTDDPLMGWGAFAAGPMQSVRVPGTHVDVFSPGNVEGLAAALRRHLGPTEARPGGPHRSDETAGRT